jgi:hypothetical protein
MTTPADYTTRIRDRIFDAYEAYQALQRRVDDIVNEYNALEGPDGIYGAGSKDWPAQSDGFELNDLTQALNKLDKLVGEPNAAEKKAIIKCRRT